MPVRFPLPRHVGAMKCVRSSSSSTADRCPYHRGPSASKPASRGSVDRVKAFGLNHAEIYFRQGAWGDVAEISGIECVGVVKSDPSGRLAAARPSLPWSVAWEESERQLCRIHECPCLQRCADQNPLSLEELAAIPESYATAWTCLFVNLELKKAIRFWSAARRRRLGRLPSISQRTSARGDSDDPQSAARFRARITRSARGPS